MIDRIQGDTETEVKYMGIQKQKYFGTGTEVTNIQGNRNRGY